MASTPPMASVVLLLAAGFAPAWPFPLPATPLRRAHPWVASTAHGYDYERPIDILEDAPRDIPTFQTWAQSYGIQQCDSFTLAYSQPDVGQPDVYAATVEDLPAGSTVLIVPEELILSGYKAMEELRGPEMSPAEKVLRSINADGELRQYYLMIKILVELQKGDQSPWYHYLNSLPRYYTNAASMTPFCCLCLPSLMRKLAVRERGNMSRLSVSSIKLIPYLNDDVKYDVELCNWVYQVVYTRAVEGPDGDWKLVPMADYFNHGSDYTEIEVSYDEAGNCYAYTTYDVPANSPLRISYGDPTNPSFLFARYGFIEDTTPATFCKIIPPHINKDMEELGYSESRMLFYANGEVSQEVWDVLLYQYLSGNAISDRRLLMKAHGESDYDTKQMLHEKYYGETSQMLLNHIEEFLASLDKLSTKAYDRYRELDDHPRLPLILKHNEFVKQSFLAVRQMYFGY